MGSGSWSVSSFASYSASTKMGATLSADGSLKTSLSNQEMFKERHLNDALNPRNVIRECKDSKEHPNTVPVILALDVTGSMGDAAVEVAKKLNVVMTKLYEKVKDVEFMIMGIGDYYCDDVPLQVSQFESDIRIAEQLDKLYFEFGGGGNAFESYTAAWYFALTKCKLDCWERGKKGIIITMGDERINPYIPLKGINSSILSSIGDTLQSDIQTKDLYEKAIEKFDIYHLNVKHSRIVLDDEGIQRSWSEYFDSDHFRNVSLDDIANHIIDIVEKSANSEINFIENTKETVFADNIQAEISW